MCLPFTTRYTTFMNQTWWIHTAGCTRGWRCVNRLTTSWMNYVNSPAKRRLSGPAKTFMTSLCHCKAAVWRVDDVTCLIEWIFKRFVHPVVQLDVQPVTHNWLYESLHDTASVQPVVQTCTTRCTVQHTLMNYVRPSYVWSTSSTVDEFCWQHDWLAVAKFSKFRVGAKYQREVP